MYADVIIDISHEKVDRPFQYRIPVTLEGKVRPGACVLVPFGKGDTLRKGYCIGVGERLQIEETKVKDIAGVSEEERSADDTLIALAAWMRAQYGSTMIKALQTVLPAHRKTKTLERRTVALLYDEEQAQIFLAECRRKKHVARVRLIEALLDAPERRLPYPLITAKLNVSSAVIEALSEKGVLTTEKERALRDPVKGTIGKYAKREEARLTLSAEQEEIVRTVTKDLAEEKRNVYLIHGVTGAGKTEVYIRLIEETVAQGRQAIVLIPEIALTWQTLIRFYRHFGERVSVMHSALSQGEKSDQFARAREGLIDVVIGPRSALFTPFPRPGLIVIDEEHELTYKSETMPKYHARETAIALSQMTADPCAVVLGSATPSLEAYDAAKRGRYKLFELTKRLTGGTLAECAIIDLRRELRNGNRSVFSGRLWEQMEDRLQKKEQTMLFINRRGLHGFVSCRSCGYVFKCPHCDVSLTVHTGGMLKCHYCGHTEQMRKNCPSCGSAYVSAFKAGTQMIEREVRKLFPAARVLRMDADTTAKRHSYEEILAAFADGEADILVGTQMIVKGHDFPNVTLVGVLAADMSLNINDFRAAERTFQLLTQAAGRAGRGTRKGDVVIQTYQPEHYAIVKAAAQDYPAFYEEEMGFRRLLRYPPAAHMLGIYFFSASEERCREEAMRMKRIAEESAAYKEAKEKPVLIGPAPASVGKIEDRYRYAFYVKHEEDTVLTAIRGAMEETEEAKDVIIQYDTDPVRGF